MIEPTPLPDLAVLKVRITFAEECLGTANSDHQIHEQYIASLAPDAPSTKEEVAALGEEKVKEKGITIFASNVDGDPCLWDYQIKGFFKDACSMMRRTPLGVWSAKLTAHKKIIDGLVFPKPRMIKLKMPAGKTLGDCQRPIRIVDKDGERVAIAHSLSVPIGTYIDVDIEFAELAQKRKKALKYGEDDDAEAKKAKAIDAAPASLRNAIIEWLNYGKYRGLGQWRNSGKGRFTWEIRE